MLRGANGLSAEVSPASSASTTAGLIPPPPEPAKSSKQGRPSGWVPP